MTNCVNYSDTIENWIIANLDGWAIETPVNSTGDSEGESSDINPFMTSEEIALKKNKIITRAECQLFYEETLDMALMHTNRLNIDDLSSIEGRTFVRAVCKWTASNLWNKYNIRVNNEDMEDTYVQSYGGLLYKSALTSLNPFINQRIMSMSDITNTDNDNDDWTIMNK